MSTYPPDPGYDYSNIERGPTYGNKYPTPEGDKSTDYAYKDTGSNSGGGQGWDFPTGGGPGKFVPGDYFSGYVAPFDKIEVDWESLVDAIYEDRYPLAIGLGCGALAYSVIQEPERYTDLTRSVLEFASATLQGIGSIIEGIGEVIPG